MATYAAIQRFSFGELSLSRKRSESLSRRVMAIKFGETFREGSQLLTVKSFGSPSALIAIGYLHIFRRKTSENFYHIFCGYTEVRQTQNFGRTIILLNFKPLSLSPSLYHE